MNPSPSPDPTVFLTALGATVLLVVLAVGLYFWKRRSLPAALTVDDAAERARAEQERKTREAERRAKEALDAAVATGRALPDGRARCQASPSCMEPAVHRAPSIPRDTGIGDFIRSRFGAPARYRMVESREPGVLAEIGRALASVWAEQIQHQPRRVEYCDVHIHVARQVCLARLSADEQAEQAHRKAREAGLAHFEMRGLLTEVQESVAAVERAPASGKAKRQPPASARGGAPRTRPTLVAPAAAPVIVAAPPPETKRASRRVTKDAEMAPTSAVRVTNGQNGAAKPNGYTNGVASKGAFS